MKSEKYAYENPWRPNYEKVAAGSWIVAAASALAVQQFTSYPSQPFLWMAGISAGMAMVRLPAAIRLANLQKNIHGMNLEFITLDKLVKTVSKKPHAQWLGNGFVWEQRHAQRAFELLRRDISSITTNSMQKLETSNIGYAWIHGVEPNEEKIFQNLDQTNLMNLIVGTTGAGKTRLFEIILVQAILRGETVIIIDPKGDKELKNTAKRICEKLGRPDKFNFFHPAFPEESVRLDLLRNFTRPTELATRLTAIAPESDNAAFTAFVWRAINNIVQGFFIINERPSILMIKHYLEAGVDKLVADAISTYLIKTIPSTAESLISEALMNAGGEDNVNINKYAHNLIKVYRRELNDSEISPELDGLISMFTHNAEHFGKMITNILPALSQLTTGQLGKMLSPNYDDLEDRRPITDNAKIISNGQVLVMGLDSLPDPVTGSSLGSLALADLVAVAGERYNFGTDIKPVNILIDEAAEVLNLSTLSLLNKGRGALMRMYVATQTIADIESRMGSPAKALQILGNLNNIISLRVIDPSTQEFIVGNLPKTRIDIVSHKQDVKADPNDPHLYSSGFGETKSNEEAFLFPSELLGQLPNLEFIAKLSGTIVKGRLPILKG